MLQLDSGLVQLALECRPLDLFWIGLGPFPDNRVLPVAVHGMSEEPRGYPDRMFGAFLAMPLAQNGLTYLQHGLSGEGCGKHMQRVLRMILGQLRM